MTALATLTLLLAAATAAAPAAVPAVKPVDTLPAAFVGRWDVGPGACTSGHSDMQLTITPTHIASSGSAGDVVAVVVRGDTEVALVTDQTGEGFHWLGTYRFLLEDGKLVDEDTVPGERIVRHRCPTTLDE